MESRWYRLDNAAKIYPILANPNRSYIFRIAANLNQEVNPEKLLEAAGDLKARFPSIYVRLRTGVFWYYYEENQKLPRVLPESPYIGRAINLQENNGYFFTLFYYKNRISLEVFHSICDGYGAMEYFKALLFRYYELLGAPVENDGYILTMDQHPSHYETEDSFLKNYMPTKRARSSAKRAYRIHGTRFREVNGHAVINGKIPASQLLALAKKHNATLTQYLAALLTYCIYRAEAMTKLSNKPVNICVPVNMRRFFESKTLRNFSLFFHTSIDCREREWDFDSMLASVKEQFDRELSKDRLHQTLNANVSIEKNIALRSCPIFIKWVLIKIGCMIHGDKLTTINMSNIGNVQFPASMDGLIHDFEANPSVGSDSTHNIGIVSYNDILSISFSRKIYETDIERLFFSHIAREGVDVEIQSNLWEDYA